VELFSLPPPPLLLLPALDGEFDHFSEELGTINIHSRCVRAVLHRQVVPDPARRAPGHRLRPPTACAGRTPRPPGSHRAALAQQGGGPWPPALLRWSLGFPRKGKLRGPGRAPESGAKVMAKSRQIWWLKSCRLVTQGFPTVA